MLWRDFKIHSTSLLGFSYRSSKAGYFGFDCNKLELSNPIFNIVLPTDFIILHHNLSPQVSSGSLVHSVYWDPRVEPCNEGHQIENETRDCSYYTHPSGRVVVTVPYMAELAWPFERKRKKLTKLTKLTLNTFTQHQHSVTENWDAEKIILDKYMLLHLLEWCCCFIRPTPRGRGA